MAHLRADNERLMLEQEKIIKRLSDRQNNRPLVPSPECRNTSGEPKFQIEDGETGGGEENREEEYDNEEAAEAWLINMNKYFQLYKYDHNLKAHLAIFQLQGKATLWWEEVKAVQGMDEQSITREKFQIYFKEKYLTERFYDEKSKEFHDLRLGKLTMDEFITKFSSLLHYVPHIREEKAKV
eukprot:PITA_30673